MPTHPFLASTRGELNPAELPQDVKFSMILTAIPSEVQGIDNIMLLEHFADQEFLNSIAAMLHAAGQYDKVTEVTDMIKTLFPEMKYVLVKDKYLKPLEAEGSEA